MLKTQFAHKSCLFAYLAAMILPAWAAAAQLEKASETQTQRVGCDAKCRDDYQSNAPALQACLRDCGAIEPNPAGAKAAGHEAAHTVQQSGGVNRTVKSSKSNSSERGTTLPGAPPPTPVEASNLNMSKTNVDRITGDESELPTEADNIATDDE